jgi:enoyl-CoA hydratase/carnithine racemase
MQFKLFNVANHGDRTATITMTRGGKLNPTNKPFFRELIEVMASVDADRSIRAAVITGEGRAFGACRVGARRQQSRGIAD